MARRVSNVTYVSSYLPMQCGIATFTRDLAQSILKEAGTTYQVVAPKDPEAGYLYPPEVWFEVERDTERSYPQAARFINESSADVVSLQHEFGLFGGPAGRYVSCLLQDLEKPVVTTLHTVLKRPSQEYRRCMREIIRYSDRLVVLSNVAGRILRDVYGVPTVKIEVIYHGVPDVPFVDPGPFKKKLSLDGRVVVLTFGLLSPSKGIERMLDALPPVTREHPEVIYVVLGATHPGVRKAFGEAYRNSLEVRVKELRLEDNVVFVPRYVNNDELFEYILASDIYVTPYLNEEQVVSGTLSYALGMGKAIISTPYLYAREILANDRGILVPFDDVGALSRSLLNLIEDPVLYDRVRKNAYKFGRRMVWKEVARKYVEVFESAFSAYHFGSERAMQRVERYSGFVTGD